MERRLTAILAADVVGYSRLIREDEEGTLAALETLRKTIITPKINKYNGRIVKLMGDGILAEFPSIVDAVCTASETQASIINFNASLPEGTRIEFRVGVNLGDIVIDGDDIQGDGVNVAARLEGLANPGGVCISGMVYEEIRDRIDLPFVDLGEQKLKNINRPIRVWQWTAKTEKQKYPDGKSGQPPTISDKPSIAILPFDNMSNDPEQEYFVDGITEDITTALSKHRWLDVIARNSCFGYKGQSVDIRRLAVELGADYVVEGSVRRAGNRIRVTAQLIDTQTGNHLWAERYDRELRDIFDVQDEITETISARVEPEVGAAERWRVARVPRRNLQAWDYYHLGVSHFFKFTAEDNLKAQQLLQLSREKDPNFGEPHAWWAYATIIGMVYWDTDPDHALLDEALEATIRALELDSQNGLFYMLKARVQLARCEYKSALSECEMAITLNPTIAGAYCGLGDSLSYEGRYDEAINKFEKAIAMSPNDPQKWAFLTYGALTYIFKEDFKTALSWTEKASEIPNCQYWTSAHKVVALAHLERRDEARRAVRNLLAEKPDFTCQFAERKLFYIKRPEQLKLYLDGLRKAGVPND